MYNNAVEKYLFYSQHLNNLSKIYSRYLRETYNKRPYVLFLNMNPIIMLNFVKYFDDATIIINKRYDFDKDELFDLKNDYTDFTRYQTIFKGLLYNYDEIDFKIRNGQKIRDEDLYYTPRKVDTVILEKVPIEEAVIYNTKHLPVIVIDATVLTTEAWIPYNDMTDRPYETLTFKRNNNNKFVKIDFKRGINFIDSNYDTKIRSQTKNKKKHNHKRVFTNDYNGSEDEKNRKKTPINTRKNMNSMVFKRNEIPQKNMKTIKINQNKTLLENDDDSLSLSSEREYEQDINIIENYD
jgi:hypothetical protein